MHEYFWLAPPACSANCAATASARSMLERSMLRYCSEPSQPSHKLPISALVTKMICNRLFNSLVAFETDSFETDLRRCGDEPSEFTIAPCSIRDALFHGRKIVILAVCRHGALGASLGCLKSRSQSTRTAVYF